MKQVRINIPIVLCEEDMITAYCSQCRRVTMMRITVMEVPNGKDKSQKTIETYHCTACGSFAGSEEKQPALTR